jgi:hypothetical protein
VPQRSGLTLQGGRKRRRAGLNHGDNRGLGVVVRVRNQHHPIKAHVSPPVVHTMVVAVAVMFVTVVQLKPLAPREAHSSRYF